MTDPTVARAVAILRDAPSVALPLTDLARRLDYGDVGALARLLGPDPRLRILDPTGFPELAALGPERAAAYDRALRAAGLRAARRVVLADPPAAPPGAGVDALLRYTTGRLLAPGTGAGPVLAAAERAHQVLQATLQGS